ncbi:MAG TPA: SMC-Scp complex subunit ScpB, partial [Pirellulales bacterium]|nr:SMC-Scp complex subunit ScpB [Pirellulales bacterium]
ISMQVGSRAAGRKQRSRWAGRRLGVAASPRRGTGFARVWHFRPKKAAALVTIAGPLARDKRLARVEAALFLAREPLASRKIAQLSSLADGTEARTLVRRLNQLYDQGGSAFRVEELAGGFQMLTRPIFGPWLRRLLQTPVETRLSPPAMETLAVIAYRQPVLRAEIEGIRGVQCGDILRQLMDRDLVRITSRSDDLGRPLLYGTTKRFLQIFGLRHLDELPLAADLRHARETVAETTTATATPHAAVAGMPNAAQAESASLTTDPISR